MPERLFRRQHEDSNDGSDPFKHKVSAGLSLFVLNKPRFKAVISVASNASLKANKN